MEREPLRPLTELLRDVRDASDAEANPAATVKAAQRRALVTWKAAQDGPRSRRAGVALAAAAALAVGVIALALRRPALTYAVGPGAEPGQFGAWIAAERGATPLTFSEGTVMTLASGSRARITRADADGASVLLERGAVHARVVHVGPSTRWSVHAGPFEIAVVGTEFDLAWDPGRDVLDVTLLEGRIVVGGPLLDDGRTLVSGERLHVSVPEHRSEVSRDAPPEAPKPSASAEPLPAAAPAPTEALPSAAPQAALPGAPQAAAEPHRELAAAPGWRALAAQGRHRETMAAVEREGFEHVLAGASAAELLELADAARYAGEHLRAREALLRARRLGIRGRSAFVLGKLAADHLGAPDESIRWFQTYLDEEPAGGLAEQALGRLIELRKRRGDAAGARAAAALYLRRHPGGAYASLAQAVAAP